MMKPITYRGYQIVLSWNEFDIYPLVAGHQVRAEGPIARAPSIEDAKDYVDYRVSRDAGELKA